MIHFEVKVMNQYMPQEKAKIFIRNLWDVCGQQTYLPRKMIEDIIGILPQFPSPGGFIGVINMRRLDAKQGFVKWNDFGEEKAFNKLETAVLKEIEKRQNCL